MRVGVRHLEPGFSPFSLYQVVVRLDVEIDDAAEVKKTGHHYSIKVYPACKNGGRLQPLYESTAPRAS